jgi:hypothetical protein
MRCLCLQPLITLRGAASVTTIAQPETGWLDLRMFRDLVAWLDVREVASTGGGATLVLNYQTSPTKDDPATGSLLTTMASVTISAGAGLTVTPMLRDLITNPLARWLRWQLVAASQTATWDATFRIWIAASMPGRGATVPLAADTSARTFESTPSVPQHVLSVLTSSAFGGTPGRGLP